MAKEEDDKTLDMMAEEAPNPENSESDLYGDMQPSLLEKEGNLRQIKPQVEGSPMQPSFAAAPIKIDYSQSNIDEIEELVESVIEEKWRSLIENFGDIGIWKEKVRTEVSSIKQELIRLENRFEIIQKAVLGKIQNYDQNIVEVSSDIKALEKVFQRIIDPFTSNIKELQKITERLKK